MTRVQAPSEEEVAALVAIMAVLAARPASPDPATPGTDNGWSARWRGLRTELRPGPDAWRLSTRH